MRVSFDAEPQLSSLKSVEVWPGRPYPFGAHWDGRGVNFALYSEHATSVELLLYDEGKAAPSYSLYLPDKTGPVWHGYLPGLKPGRFYGYRVHGPFDPSVVTALTRARLFWTLTPKK